MVAASGHATVNIHHREKKREIGWRIPAPSAYATGQEGYLRTLRAILDAGETGGITQPAGLRGLGGVGKTELALAYAKAYRKEYDAGAFMVADSLSALDFALAKIADPDLPPDAKQDTIGPLRDQALRDLNAAGRTLVVFDNVDEIVGSPEFQAVLAALPEAHLIVTCRHRDMGERVRQLPVQEMDEATGALYVLRRGLGEQGGKPWAWEDFSERDRTNALELTRELDGLPLALDHAGAAIRNDPMTVAEALADYRSNRVRILSNRGAAASATHPDSAQVTVVRAFERLKVKDPAAAELVVCCAFLAPEAIAEDLFTKGLIDLPEPLAGAIERFTAVRAAAVRSALIERDAAVGRLTIHRVVQTVLQEAEGVDAPAWLMRITNRTVSRLLDAGRYPEAVAHAEYGVPEITRNLGEVHADTLTLRNNLAAAYWKMGRYGESLAIHEANLPRIVASFGEAHPITLTCLNNLGTTYQELGRYAEALPLLRAALDGWRATTGVVTRDTLSSSDNLGTLYRHMKRYEEALREQEPAVEEMTKMFGERDPMTLRAMNNLSETYRAMERHQEAFELRWATAAGRRSVLGDCHPETLTSLHNLAVTLYELRRFTEALPLFQEAADVRKAVLGADHPATQLSFEYLEICKRTIQRFSQG